MNESYGYTLLMHSPIRILFSIAAIVADSIWLDRSVPLLDDFCYCLPLYVTIGNSVKKLGKIEDKRMYCDGFLVIFFGTENTLTGFAKMT